MHPDVYGEELEESFEKYFGARWSEVLDATDKSPAYNAANSGYFSVRGLRGVKGLNLEELLENNTPIPAANILSS